jgi:kumamolisin
VPDITQEQSPNIPEGYHALHGSERRPAPGTKLIGPADPNESFAVTIVLRRRPDGPPVPRDYELHAARKLGPPMGQDEFAAKYGAAPEDVEKVSQFVKAHGMAVVETHLARRTAVASGTVAQMGKAFAVELGAYEYATPPRRGEATYRGRDGWIAVPKELAEIVLGVFGLDNRAVGQDAANGDPHSTSTLTVKKVTELYKFPDPGPRIAEQTIGIISPGGNYGYLESDLDSYFNSVGEKKITTTDISVAGAVNGASAPVTTAQANAGTNVLTFGPHQKIKVGYWASDKGGVNYYGQVTKVTSSATSTTVNLGQTLTSKVAKGTTIYFEVGNETTQDVCVAASAAPGAHIAVYFAPNTQQGWIAAFLRAIWPDANDFRQGISPPFVLSCSFGLTQGDDQRGKYDVTLISILMLDSFFALDSVVRGVTICACTGDNGSQGFPNKLADGHAHVWYPASDPYVLAVGGTTIGKTESGEWVEYVWNDASGATGGGVSDVFAVPYWQSHLGIPDSVNHAPFAKRGRGIPDVAANASTISGYPMFFCGGKYTASGTSAATPLWAGLLSIINSYQPNPWGPIGYINWILYWFAASWTLFNPLNPLWREPGKPNLAGCPTNNGYNGVKGYPATTYWDACTGQGSPIGKALLEMFIFDL